MSGRGNRKQASGEEYSKREARADRILDTTLELVQRWGYKKTTIDDIAKQADVSSGGVVI